jgi:hypothetical protein
MDRKVGSRRSQKYKHNDRNRGREHHRPRAARDRWRAGPARYCDPYKSEALHGVVDVTRHPFHPGLEERVTRQTCAHTEKGAVAGGKSHFSRISLNLQAKINIKNLREITGEPTTPPSQMGVYLAHLTEMESFCAH